MEDELYPIVDVALTEVNYIDFKPNPSMVRESYEITIQNCIPRPVPGLHHRPKAKKQRPPWSIPISLFKDYTVDTEVWLLVEVLLKSHENHPKGNNGKML